MAQEDQPVQAATLKAPPVYIAIVIQVSVSMLAALVSWLMLDVVVAYSVLLGGLICSIPNGYFARKAFQFRGARASEKIVKSFYQGEAVKIALVVAGFGVVLKFVHPLNVLAVFLGYIVIHVTGQLAVIFVLKRHR